MDGGKGISSQQDASVLFEMLESSDQQTVDSVKALIHENFSATKDAWLVNGLLDYYIAVQSNRALDVLISVREPHDKHLFDRMVDYLKTENTRYHCLLLLSHLIYRQPSWLFKITQHRIFQVLLNLLKTEVDLPCLMCALFSIISLLPMIPSQISSYLNDIFEIFSRMVTWSSKKSNVVEVSVLHLHVGVYALFHRLYGMFPCNFLSYLRSYYGGREYKEENIRVFTSSIRPMLEKVRLHPLLVTACKETELSQKRWKRMATHDIIALCASVSLDAVEGTQENVQGANAEYGSIFPSQSTRSQENSMQYFSLSSMSSTVSTNPEIDSITNRCDSSWTPSRICSLSTPPPDSSLINSLEDDIQESQSSITHDFIDNNEDQPSTDQGNIEINAIPENEIFLVDTIEAGEEELVDNEVCELTSVDLVTCEPEITRHDTPFRSTTQNLTDKAEFTALRTNSLEGKDGEVIGDESHSDIESPELKMESLVRTINRLRYFSQCGPPPEISEFCLRSVLRRSISCPQIRVGEVNVPSNYASHGTVLKNLDDMPQISAQSDCHNSNLWCEDSVYGQRSTLKLPHTPYDHLIPLALQPYSLGEKIFVSDAYLQPLMYKSPDYTPFYCSLSPAELLDRHIQMGSDAHLVQLSSIPLTSTKHADWTHFGGSPPLEEISISRTQIQLLHNQVMFERHRREIHAERNRRLLGRVKKSQIHEENTTALEDQILLLQKEIDELKDRLKIHKQLFCEMEEIKNQAKEEFSASLEKLMQDNTNLQYSNKKLQGLLVSQKEENDVLKNEAQFSRSQLLDVEFKIELASSEQQNSSKLEKDLSYATKENLLLREINLQYKEKDPVKEPKSSGLEEVMQEALHAELKSIKQTLDSKVVLIDALRGKITSLEEEQNSLKSKLKEQGKLIDQMKEFYRNEISVRDDRLADMQKINEHYASHILKVYHEMNVLREGGTVLDCDELFRSFVETADSINMPNMTTYIDLEELCSNSSAANIDDDLEIASNIVNYSSDMDLETQPNGADDFDDF